MLLPLAASVLVLAAAALGFWLRGKPADGHPLCRRCRFDLIGTPDGLTCPECGADLQRRRATRINNRRRSRPLLAIGVVLLLTAGGLTVPAVRSHVATIDWNHHKPTWWLMRQTRSTDPAVVGPTLRELLARYEGRELPGGTVLALAEQGFGYLNAGAPCGMWNSEYGNFIDIAIAMGLFGGERKSSYMLNSVGLHWSGPSHRAYPNAPANPIFTVLALPYVGSPFRSLAAPPPIDFAVREFSATLDGAPLKSKMTIDNFGTLWDPPVASASHRNAIIELPADWQDRTLVLSWTIQIVDLRTRAPIGEPWTGERTIKLDAPVEGGARRQDDQPPPDISRY